MAGNEYVSFNNSVFLAEREVSDRNFALSYYMKENKCFPKGSNIKDCLDFWYQVYIDGSRAVCCIGLNYDANLSK